MLGLYPRPAPWSVSYLTACTVVGTWVGLALALWWVHAGGDELLLVFRGWGARAQEYVQVYSQVGGWVKWYLCLFVRFCLVVVLSLSVEHTRSPERSLLLIVSTHSRQHRSHPNLTAAF